MVKKSIGVLFYPVRYHKLKILTLFVSLSLFFVLLFPLNELSDLVSSSVAQGTNNAVVLSFDDMGFQFAPTPGIGMSQVRAHIRGVGLIELARLQLVPAWVSLLSLKPGAMVRMRGLYQGDLDFFAQLTNLSGTKARFELSSQKVSLTPIVKQFAPIDTQVKGIVSLDVNGDLDLTFAAPPEISANVSVSDVDVATFMVPTPMGPMQLPQLAWKTLSLQGRIAENKVFLDPLQIGVEGDDIEATIRGEMGLNIQQQRVVPGRYDISVQLKIRPSSQVMQELGVLLKFFRSAQARRYVCFSSHGATWWPSKYEQPIVAK